jgi:hypothetical protein
MTNILLVAIFLVLCVFMIGFIVYAKSVLKELDRVSVLLTVLANKQGCTQEDIDAAIGKSSKKK